MRQGAPDDNAKAGHWTVPPDSDQERADVFLARALGVSRAEAQRLLESRAAMVNGAPSRPSRRLRAGDAVEGFVPEPVEARLVPEAIALQVVYEDADLMVVDKPRGMVVHPAPGNPTGTLANAALAHAADLAGIGGELRPGIVHRLDKDTTGLLVIAKSDAALASLQRQIQERTARRVYWALVWGQPRFEEALVEAPIGRSPADRKKMAVVTQAGRGRPALTDLRVLERLGPCALLEARLRTGRTHQIRVHCAHIGHPVVGDPLYGGQRRFPGARRGGAAARAAEAAEALGGQALHARELSFDHPRTGERLRFEAPLPPDMTALLDALRALAAEGEP